MSTFYAIAGELFVGDAGEYGVGMFADVVSECRQKPAKTRRERGVSARKAAAPSRMELGDYLAACPGVAPWTVGKIVREFHGHDARMDMMATAFLVQHENPGVPPAALWKRTVKEWLKVVKLSLGMTGRGGISADRRFAAVDATCDLSQVVAATYDEAKWQAAEEQGRVAELVATLLDSVQHGLGTALRDGKTMDEAAAAAGCSLATAYRRVDAVREMLAA